MIALWGRGREEHSGTRSERDFEVKKKNRQQINDNYREAKYIMAIHKTVGDKLLIGGYKVRPKKTATKIQFFFVVWIVISYIRSKKNVEGIHFL